MSARRTLAALAITIAVLGAATPAHAGKKTCLTGTNPEVALDAGQIRAVRALIDGACVCASFDGGKGATHGDYVKCAVGVAKSAVTTQDLRSACKGVVQKQVSQSTCGFPANPRRVVCITRTLAKGKVTCKVQTTTKKDGTPKDTCIDKANSYTRIACPDHALCVDAADSNGDLLIGAPGDSGACNPVATATPDANTLPTRTPVITATSTPTVTATRTVTPIPTLTATPTATVTPTPTPTATPTATVTPQVLTLVKAGVGTGTVTAVEGGIDCGATCSAGYAANQTVTLQARTTNGSDSYFQGWSGGGCTGPFHDCTVTMEAATAVTATFASQTFNLVFVSSTTFATDLGSAMAYDDQCNALATAAGINDVAGDAFVAWISDGNFNAAARLRDARGFVRLDGKAFIDDKLSNHVLNPIRFDENGGEPASDLVMTATGSDGKTVDIFSCDDWTSDDDGDTALGGSRFGGPGNWSENVTTECGLAQRIICMMSTRDAALSPAPDAGKKVYLTDTAYIPDGDPDAKCDADKPTGTGSVKALLAYKTAPASNVVDASATYVRPDGQIVGTGAELLAGGAGDGPLQSGIWQSGDGIYRNDFGRAWTGQTTLTHPGTSDGTCFDWTSDTVGPAPITGLYLTADARWWSFDTSSCSDTGNRLICIEQ